MKQPKIPSKPHSPYVPYLPQKEMDTTSIVKRVMLRLYTSYTWQELQEELIGTLDPKTLERSRFEFVSEGDTRDLNCIHIIETKKSPNPNYEAQKKQYEKDKAKYDKDLEIYKDRMKEYEVKYKVYEQEKEEYELEQAKKTVERIEKKKAKTK